MVTRTELFESADVISLYIFLSVQLDEERSLQKNRGHTRRIVRSHFGCCCNIKKREDQLRRTTRDHRTAVAKCTEVDGGIFERLL